MTNFRVRAYLFILTWIFCCLSIGLITSSFFSTNKLNNDYIDVRNIKASNYGMDWYAIWDRGKDIGEKVILDDSGNIYVVGFSIISDSFDIFISKYDNDGILQWNAIWDRDDYDSCRDITLDASGNIYITGSVDYNVESIDDTFIVKYNNDGIQQWNITWGGNYWEGKGIALDASGNIYITGSVRRSSGRRDFFIAKFDNTGIYQWNTTWDRTTDDYGYKIVFDNIGNIYILGNAYSSSSGSNDAYIAKFNNAGILEWDLIWGGNASEIVYDGDLVLDSLGNIYISGSTDSYGAGQRDAFILKCDNDGILQWNITWGSLNYENGNGIALDISGDIYLTGSFNRDAFVAKFDSMGFLKWNITWGGAQSEIGFGIALDASKNYYITGKTESFGGYSDDVFIVKFNHDPNPPEWLQVPSDQISEYGISFSYNVNAYDFSGILAYWVNDTDNFDIDSTGLITNSSFLSIGVYWLEIYVNDTFGNVNMTTIKISVQDTLPPEWDQVPVDQIIEYGVVFAYDVNASDPSGIDTYWINDTINFQIDDNGLITNPDFLSTGQYWLEISVNDTLGHINMIIIKITILEKSIQDGASAIPGFNSLFIILISFTLISIFVWRKKRNLIFE